MSIIITSSFFSRLSRALIEKRRRRSLLRYHSVLFLGTDEVSSVTLTKLISLRLSSSPAVSKLDIVTPADRPQGRGREMRSVPVMELAKKHLHGAVNSIVQVPYGLRDLSEWKDGIASLHAMKPDVGVVVSFGYFLPPVLLDVFRKQFAINMHPSLLPRHRGAAPIPHAILAGDTETGVSIIDVDRNAFDSGAILLQQGGVRIGDSETSSSLSRRLSELGADSVEKVLLDLDGYRERRTPQLVNGATKAPKLKPEHGLVTLLSLESDSLSLESDSGSSSQLLRKWRAFEDSIGLYCFFGESNSQKRLKLIELSALPPDWCPKGQHSIGSIVFDPASKILGLLTSKGVWIRLVKVQPEFKRIMTGEEFGRGLKGSLQIN
jgi:methionyl-tRNA formyltransferase